MNEWLPKFKGKKLLAEIEKSASGLTFISETDAPIEAFASEEDDPLGLCSIVKDDTRSDEYEVIPFEKFFQTLTAEKEWFGPKQKAKARRFGKLEKLLKENLRRLKVLRIGHIQIDIYVVGLDIDNNLIGIKTKAVET